MKKGSINYEYYLKTLKKSPHFSALSDEILEEILNSFHLETWTKGSLSIDGNKTLNQFYFLTNGRIKVFQIHPESGNEFTMYLLSSGKMFDIISLLDGKRHDVQMEALDDVEILAAPIDTVREWIIKHPQFNKTLLPYLADQLREIEEKATDLALSDTWTRTLKLFVQHIGSDTSHSKLKLINTLSHNELAKIVGTSRNVINRHIQTLKNEDILSVKHKHIEINDLQKLLDKLKIH